MLTGACTPEVDSKPIQEPKDDGADSTSAPSETGEPRVDGESTPRPAPERFTIRPPETIVWGVLDGVCRRLLFEPRSEDQGRVLIAGRQVQYRLTGNQLELFTFSESNGDGLSSTRCRTMLELRDDGRLGQSDMFRDQASCEARRDLAAPLDDSPELITTKCSGADLAVDTEQIVCGPEGRHGILAKPGCLTVVAENLAADSTTP